MAAQSACGLSEKPCAVVPTTSVPQAFSALFGLDEDASLEENVEAMTEAYADVRTGEDVYKRQAPSRARGARRGGGLPPHVRMRLSNGNGSHRHGRPARDRPHTVKQTVGDVREGR